MPINPNIAMGYRPIQLENPMNAMAQMSQIQNYQQTNQLNQMKMEEARLEQANVNAMNNAYKDAFNPETNSVDYNRLYKSLAASGQGSRIPGVQKLQFEGQQAGANLQKTQGDIAKGKLDFTKTEGDIAKGKVDLTKAESDLLDSRLKQSRQFLDTINPADPNAPNLYRQWHAANHNDPVLGPALKARGITADQAESRIEQAIAQGPAAFAQLLNQSKLGTEKFMEMNKPTTQVVDQSGQKQVFQTPGLGGAPTSVGTYPDVPLPSGVEAQQLRMRAAGAPKTNVSVSTGGQSDYIKALGKAVGETNAKTYTDASTGAKNAVRNMPKLQETLDLINKGSAITGFGAEVFKDVERFKAKFLADPVAGKKVTDTEVLDAMLGSDVFPMIQSLGIGARGLDTPKEVAFLRAVMTGAITMNAATLKRMTEFRMKVAKLAIDGYNAQVDAGDFKDIGIAQGRVVERIELPKATPNPGKVDAANPHLN